MSITVNRATRHLNDWSVKLAPYPTRANWPAHLFHTCQLEVAVEIVKSGGITCRSKVGNLICDVANQGAVWNNPNAHNYVRLYFRPRNSFHLKTEGVKAVGDRYRVDPHMSIPIAFAFDFQKVITLPSSGFVPGNFAKTGAAPLVGDAEFDKLQFDLIYHDSALTSDKLAEVHNWRMSEVVVSESLALSNLSYVICRTTHEERTFRYALGKGVAPPKIIVEQKGSIFMRRGMFIDEIYWSSNLLHVQFHGPTVFPKEKYAMKVLCWDRGTVRQEDFLVAPGRYHFPTLPASKDAIWRIELEGCVVYHAPIPSMSGLVVS
jgi:ssDNA thymidine ADP-ribosyltransferase, DarT